MSNYNLDPLNDQAIDAAVSGKWTKAIELNIELTKKYPDQAEIFNRLAKAYIETAQLDEAKAAYQSALGVDPYNHIAKKNLEKISTINVRDLQKSGGSIVSPDLFLEEPGKTKMIALEDLAMGKVVSTLKIGDRLQEEINGNSITLLTAQGKRIGKLDEDTAFTVAQAIRKGSKFEYIVKSIELTDSSIKPMLFVKEVVHSPKLNAPVFAPKMAEAVTHETPESDELHDDVDSHDSSQADAGGAETPIGEQSIDEMITESPQVSVDQYDEENEDVVTELPDIDDDTPEGIIDEEFSDSEDNEETSEQRAKPTSK